MEEAQNLCVLGHSALVCSLFHVDVPRQVLVWFVHSFINVNHQYRLFFAYRDCLSLEVDGRSHVFLGGITHLITGLLYLFVVQAYNFSRFVFTANNYYAALGIGHSCRIDLIRF